jgi:hypothetical protein
MGNLLSQNQGNRLRTLTQSSPDCIEPPTGKLIRPAESAAEAPACIRKRAVALGGDIAVAIGYGQVEGEASHLRGRAADGEGAAAQLGRQSGGQAAAAQVRVDTVAACAGGVKIDMIDRSDTRAPLPPTEVSASRGRGDTTASPMPGRAIPRAPIHGRNDELPDSPGPYGRCLSAHLARSSWV